MIVPQNQKTLGIEISSRAETDRDFLDKLRVEIKPLRSSVQYIQLIITKSISFIGTDGGNYQQSIRSISDTHDSRSRQHQLGVLF